MDKRVIEVANFLFANPSKRTADVLSVFGGMWRISARTLERIIKEAKEYNRGRIERLEEKRAEVLVEREIEVVKEAITTRERILEIMNDLAEGVPQEILVGRDETGEGIYKTIPVLPQDRIRAANVILEVEGWKAPIETISKVRVNTDDLSKDEREAILSVARKTQR